jgi:hypothetical protein
MWQRIVGGPMTSSRREVSSMLPLKIIIVLVIVFLLLLCCMIATQSADAWMPMTDHGNEEAAEPAAQITDFAFPPARFFGAYRAVRASQG